MREADDRGLRRVGRKRAKGRGRSIIVGRQAGILDQDGGRRIA
jgi:hypothetical protein